MSQKKRLEILRCVVLLKVFSKKRSFLVQKTRPPLPSETILSPFQVGPVCSALQGCRLLFVMILLETRRLYPALLPVADKLLLPARNKQILPGLP
jgi:hypothetical protein